MSENLLPTSIIFLLFGSFAGADQVIAQIPPLVDGYCQEYSALGADSIDVSQDVKLNFYQDAHYVWLCYTYPEGSLGVVDMVVETESLREPINLHVSAQIGEWPSNKPELAPQNPESERWWNARGWTANPVWINGMDTSSAEPRYRFKNAPARELQLSKERFGRGEWRIRLDIYHIKDADGNHYNVQFPENGQPYVLKVE